MKQKPAELGEFQGYFFNSVFSIKISFESDNSVNFYDFLKIVDFVVYPSDKLDFFFLN